MKQYNARLFREPKATPLAKQADRQRSRVLTSMRPLRTALATIAAESTHAHELDARTIALVGCGKSKGKEQALARYLYRSPLFEKSLALAELLTPHTFIVSAAHGLMRPDAVVLPYDHDLRSESPMRRRAWAREVLHDLRACAGTSRIRVVLLMGSAYSDPLRAQIDTLRESSTGWLDPVDLLRGLEIGDRLCFLNHAIKLARAVREER